MTEPMMISIGATTFGLIISTVFIILINRTPYTTIYIECTTCTNSNKQRRTK